MAASQIESNVNFGFAEAYQNLQISYAINQALTTAQELIKKVQVASQEIFKNLQDHVTSTPLEPLIAAINHVGTDIEKGFNIAGSSPIICIISAPLRILAGKLQILVGAVIAGIGELALLISDKPQADNELMQKWRTVSKLGTEHIIHGCLNILRGSGESLVSAWTMGIGNVFLLVPNLTHQRNFAPYFAYGTLIPGSVNEPNSPPSISSNNQKLATKDESTPIENTQSEFQIIIQEIKEPATREINDPKSNINS